LLRFHCLSPLFYFYKEHKKAGRLNVTLTKSYSAVRLS
jgi:hypothetical protein